MPSPNIWIAASDNDIASISHFLSLDPSSVNARDENGYTPLHAAASYNHLALLKSLVTAHGGNTNITDNDGDTPLFVVETVDAARCLVTELGADPAHRNLSGLTAAESIEDDGGFPLVVAYLRELELLAGTAVANGVSPPQPPPPTPQGLEVNYSTMDEVSEMDVSMDDALRQRIEELAQRNDFESEETQRELRELITSALRDHVVNPESDRNVRARQDE